jgi:hypothetical protein
MFPITRAKQLTGASRGQSSLPTMGLAASTQLGIQAEMCHDLLALLSKAKKTGESAEVGHQIPVTVFTAADTRASVPSKGIS